MKKITLAIIALLSTTLASAQYLAEGFEGNTIPPAGWNVVDTNPNQNWETVTGLTSGITASEGTYAAAVLFDLGQQNETLISPTIDLSGATNPQLTLDISLSYFWAVSPNNNYDVTISVVQGVNSTPIWTEADLGVFNGGEWYSLVLDLSAYVGSSITLQINYTGADGDYVLIDDIVVEEAPACAPADNLSFDDFTATTADISWNNTGTFTVEWGEFPYAQGGTGTSVSVTGDNYQLTNLTPGVSYDVYVTQDCGTNGTSITETVVVGTVPDFANATFPFTEDFEVDANQALILNLGLSFFTNTNNWDFGQDNLADNDTTNDFAFDGVGSVSSNNTFSNAAADATIYLGPFSLTTGNEYTFSFQQRNLVASTATIPSKDIEVVAALTNDGANNIVLNTFDDMDNTTYTLRSSTFIPPANGDYYFGIRDKTDLLTGVTAGNRVFVDAITLTSTLGIDGENLNLFTLSPNPATDFIQINNTAPIQSIEIINALGQRVLANATIVNDRVNIKDLNSGMYFLKATSAQGSQTVRFLKN